MDGKANPVPTGVLGVSHAPSPGEVLDTPGLSIVTSTLIHYLYILGPWEHLPFPSGRIHAERGLSTRHQQGGAVSTGYKPHANTSTAWSSPRDHRPFLSFTGAWGPTMVKPTGGATRGANLSTAHGTRPTPNASRAKLFS